MVSYSGAPTAHERAEILSFGPGAARPRPPVSDLITPELLERELDESVLMMPGPVPVPVPVRASDVTIQSISDEARPGTMWCSLRRTEARGSSCPASQVGVRLGSCCES